MLCYLISNLLQGLYKELMAPLGIGAINVSLFLLLIACVADAAQFVIMYGCICAGAKHGVTSLHIVTTVAC